MEGILNRSLDITLYSPMQFLEKSRINTLMDFIRTIKTVSVKPV